MEGHARRNRLYPDRPIGRSGYRPPDQAVPGL